MEVQVAQSSQLAVSDAVVMLGNRKLVPPGRTKQLVDLRTFEEVKNLAQLVNDLGRASATVRLIVMGGARYQIADDKL